MSNEVVVGEAALGRVAARSFRFLVALARYPRLMALMRTRGFTAEVQAEGWALVDRVAGRGTVAPVVIQAVDESVQRAIERIDAWVTTNVPVARATLMRRFPTQHNFLFADGLGVAHGPDAVRVATTLGARLDALASSPERDDTRDEDAAALSLLAARGITADDRARLAARVATVQRAALAPAPEAAPAEAVRSLPPPAEDPRAALYVWFSEWSEIARAVTPRRADQIKLGLASPRRARAAGSEEGDEEEEDDATEEDADEPAPVAAAPKKDAVKRTPAKRAARGTPSSAPSPA